MSSRVDVEQARRMRAEGATLQTIGNHFGVTRERIRQLVGTTELPPANCDQCGKQLPALRPSSMLHCSRACAIRAHNARQQRSTCPQCDGTKAAAAKVCRTCHFANVSVEHDNALVVELWARGESMSTIAAALDTTVNALGVRIYRMRGEGYDLPYRRRVFLNGEPAYPDLEVREYRAEPVALLTLNTKEIVARGRQREKSRARAALHAAEDRGVVTRPDSCSRCGARARIEAHHADYSKPLEVEWLCFPCHRSTHTNHDQLSPAA